MSDRILKPGWKTWRFDQMAINVNDRVDNPAEAGVDRYVGLEHLDPDSLKIRRWGSPTDVEATKLRFRKGDIIFGRRRVYQRKLAVADFDGICSAHAMVLRAIPEVVIPEFLPFFIQSDIFMNRASEISVGSLSPTINWKTLAAQPFSLPTLAAQRQAANVFRSALENIEAQWALSMASSVSHNAYINHIIRSGTGQTEYSPTLPKLAPEWSYASIEELCSDIVDCLHRTPVYQETGYPAIRTADLEPGVLNLENAFRVSKSEYLVQTSRLKPEPGDVLFSREGERLGMAALVPLGTEICISQRMMLLRPKLHFPAALLMELMNSPWVQNQIWRKTAGSAAPHLNVQDVRDICVPVPPQRLWQSYSNNASSLLEMTLACRDRSRHAATIARNLREEYLSQVLDT